MSNIPIKVQFQYRWAEIFQFKDPEFLLGGEQKTEETGGSREGGTRKERKLFSSVHCK